MLSVAGSKGLRAALLAVVLVGTTAGLTALSPAAGAQPQQCSMSGGIGGPNPAHVGDLVSVSVSVEGKRFCNGTTVTIYGGGRALCNGGFIFGRASCSITFRAFMGLGTVTASINTGQSIVLGAFTVLDRPPTTPHSQPGHPVPRTVTHTVTPANTTGRTTPVARVKIPAPTKPDPHHKSSAAQPDPYPWHPAPGPTAPPSEEPGASVSAVAVVTSAHGGGASPIPLGLLIGSLVVLGGLVAAATRLVTIHTRTQVGP